MTLLCGCICTLNGDGAYQLFFVLNSALCNLNGYGSPQNECKWVSVFEWGEGDSVRACVKEESVRACVGVCTRVNRVIAWTMTSISIVEWVQIILKVSENCEYFFQVHFWQMRRTCSIGCESIFRFLIFLFINIESVRSKFAEILRQQRTIERTRICANTCTYVCLYV